MKCKYCGEDDSTTEKCFCRECVGEPWRDHPITYCNKCNKIINAHWK